MCMSSYLLVYWPVLSFSKYYVFTCQMEYIMIFIFHSTATVLTCICLSRSMLSLCLHYDTISFFILYLLWYGNTMTESMFFFILYHRCLGLIGEWSNLVTGEKLHWPQGDSNPGPCRQHVHCCQRTKPLRHPDTVSFDQFSK